MSDATSVGSAKDRRWFILGVIGLAQLMVVLDLTVMNIALPSAQRALHFTTADRQWVVTAYSLAFGSLLLPGGRLADLLGRKVTFLTGLAGFAIVSAIGGASVNFAMLVTARACQGAFAALLVPSALSLLTTTFTEPKDRGKAFGIYGAIASAGGAVGLLLGGALTEYLSWRWTLYVNLVFAVVAFTGGALWMKGQSSRVPPRLDVPGALLVSGAVFCLVYGFSNAATKHWATPSTYGFLAVGVVLLVVFARWQGRAARPLLPPRVVLDRNRGGANASMLIATAGLFGVLLFLTYYLQQTVGYSPLVTGVAFLPMSAGLIVMSNLSTTVLMPRFGPRPLVASGMLAAAGGAVWLAQLGPHTGYAVGVLGPLILAGIGLGLVIAPGINTATFGAVPQDAGVAAATVTAGQMLGGSVGTSLLNTIFASAVASYLAGHLAAARIVGRQALTGLALAHGYDPAFWWTAGIFAAGAVIAGALLRPGPLDQQGTPAPAQDETLMSTPAANPTRLNPTEGKSSVSTEQRETLDAILRQSAFPADSDVTEQRRLLRELLSAVPLPADVTVTAAALGGVPTAEITVDGIEPRHVVLYFHGGVYVMGDAASAAGLAAQIGRRTQAKVISVDYRLAPEHPYPAAVDDALAAYQALLEGGTAPADIAFAGESAGGGLAIATLVNARDHGLPLPAAAFVMSPYADLTLSGTTLDTKSKVDPLLSREALQARVGDYTSGQDPALGLISPIFADLSGLPPLIIQAGTHEVLLDDAIRLARQAATADVEFTHDIPPGVPHVFQAYHPILDEAAAALDRAGSLLSAHLAGAERVTA